MNHASNLESLYVQDFCIVSLSFWHGGPLPFVFACLWEPFLLNSEEKQGNHATISLITNKVLKNEHCLKECLKQEYYNQEMQRTFQLHFLV